MKMSKLFKRALAITIFTAFATISLNVAAAPVPYAASNTARAASICNFSNTSVTKTLIAVADSRIDYCVKTAQMRANILLKMGYTSDSVKIQTICTNLQDDTQAIVDQTSKILDMFGAQYEFSNYYVNVGGNQVLIDPLLWVG